jgi:protein SCO1/2
LTTRTQLVLVVVGLLALGGLVAAVVAGSSDSGGGAASVEEVEGPFQGRESPFEGALRPEGVQQSDFTLENQDGDLVRIADERGKVVVLTPLYTTCEDTCPIVAQQVRGALDDLSAADRREVVAHAISVDPVGDTPEQARRFLVDRRVSGYLDFLLGDRAELAPVWREFGFAPQTEEQEHNAYVVLLNREGRQRIGFPVEHLTPEGLRHDIELLLKGVGDQPRS